MGRLINDNLEGSISLKGLRKTTKETSVGIASVLA
jgi:hypothetical protein